MENLKFGITHKGVTIIQISGCEMWTLHEFCGLRDRWLMNYIRLLKFFLQIFYTLTRNVKTARKAWYNKVRQITPILQLNVMYANLRRWKSSPNDRLFSRDFARTDALSRFERVKRCKNWEAGRRSVASRCVVVIAPQRRDWWVVGGATMGMRGRPGGGCVSDGGGGGDVVTVVSGDLSRDVMDDSRVAVCPAAAAAAATRPRTAERRRKTGTPPTKGAQCPGEIVIAGLSSLWRPRSTAARPGRAPPMSYDDVRRSDTQSIQGFRPRSSSSHLYIIFLFVSVKRVFAVRRLVGGGGACCVGDDACFISDDESFVAGFLRRRYS